MKKGAGDARRVGGAARAGQARSAPRVPPAATRAPAFAAADPEDASAAARSLWFVLIALALVRAALAFIPGMWWWGANTLRFVAPAWGWSLWAIAAAMLIPSVARRATPAFSRVGDALVAHPTLVALAGAAIALLVWSLPDRLYFVGDFMMRLGSALGRVPPENVFPQATPLDLLLHYRLPVWLRSEFGVEPLLTERVLGAIKAALLAGLGVAYARALRLNGGAALATAAIVIFGGYLGLFTGFGKALGELVVITACIGVCAMWMVLEGRGLLLMGATLALGILLHRSGSLLLVPAAVAWIAWFRCFGGGGRWRRWDVALALALPAGALGLAIPRMLVTFTATDREHLALGAATGGAGLAGVLAALASRVHLADALDHVLLLSPLAVALPFVAAPLLRHARRRPDAAVVAAFALVASLTILLVHPRQGELRDWDVFAPSAAALSLALAWVVGETLRAAPRQAWLAPAVVCAALAPTIVWIGQGTDVPRGIARVRAYLTEEPRRADPERAQLWAWLGVRHLANQQREAAAEAYREAAAIAPSPRFLVEWAIAEADLGHARDAQAILLRAVGRGPNMAGVWVTLATVTADLGEIETARGYARRALEIDPKNRSAAELLSALERADTLGSGQKRNPVR